MWVCFYSVSITILTIICITVCPVTWTYFFCAHHVLPLSYLNSCSTNHAGVILSCRRLSMWIMSWSLRWILTAIFLWVTMTKICKRESAKWRDIQIEFVCIFSYGLTNVACFCHHSHQSACSKKADGRLQLLVWSGLPLMFVSERWKKWVETDVNVRQMTTLLLLHFPLCVWNKVIFFSILWINTGTSR